jgi:hypothetical protein
VGLKGTKTPDLCSTRPLVVTTLSLRNGRALWTRERWRSGPGRRSQTDTAFRARGRDALRPGEVTSGYGAAPNAARLLKQLEIIGYREVAERRYDDRP